MNESIDISWIKWALGGISAACASVAAYLHVGQLAQSARIDLVQKEHTNTIENIRQKISDSHDNSMRDIWQALEADRKSSHQYREIVLTGLARAATKDDLTALGRDIAAQFQRRKDT